VYFRLVDAPGQMFVRGRSPYDLKMKAEVEEGQLEVVVKGVDGEDIKVDISGQTCINVPGKGMPQDWQGGDRGDLIIEVTRL
jgi:DnaJ-class molecular chaperone